ncbi:MAG: hypothetical protein ABI946_07410 [Chthoniobacterales bacterium]
MKNLLRLLLVVAWLSGSAFLRAERVPADSVAKIKTYQVADLQKLDRIPLRQLIAIKFNYRHQKIRHLKPNWFQGSLWGYAVEGKKKYVFVQVMVSKEDLPAFKAITTDFQAGAEQVAYGQVLQDREATKWRFVRLFGTKMERDAAGNATVSW